MPSDKQLLDMLKREKELHSLTSETLKVARNEVWRLRAALELWLAYDNLDEADFAQPGPLLLYGEAIEATRVALQPLT